MDQERDPPTLRAHSKDPTRETIERYVIAASDYGTRIPGLVRNAISGFAIAATIFVFTAFYVLVDAERIGRTAVVIAE